MQSYQQIVDDMQDAVRNPHLADLQFLRDTAALYAEACVEVNTRLRKVSQLLRKSLRSEAIEQAEEQPNILDAYGLLNLPELSQWRSMLAGLEMTPPPELNHDLAAEVEQAYTAQLPQDALLRQHRLLALGRAPLAARISVLRRLVSSEEHSPAWEEDLRSLETARLKEIGPEATAAEKAVDLVALGACRQEVMDTGWSVDVPQSLRDRVLSLCQQSLTRESLGALERIEPLLNEAHMALDEQRCISLEAEWRKAASIVQLPADHPLAEKAAPALEWARSCRDKQELQQQQALAVLELEQALDDGAPTDELTRLFNEASFFETPPPDQVVHRYWERIESDRESAVRRNRLAIAGVVGAVLLIGGGTALAINHQLHRREITGAVRSIQSLNETRNFQEANQRYEQLLAESPEVAKQAGVQEAHAETLAGITEEDERLKAFAAHLQTLEGWAPPAAFPSDSYQAALSKVKTDAERESVEAHKRRHDEHEASRESQDSQGLALALREQAESLAEVRRVAQDPRLNIPKALNRLGNIRSKVLSLPGKHPRADSVSKQSAHRVVAETEKLMESLRAEQKARLLVTDVTHAVGDWNAFRKALQAYLALDNEAGAQEFQQRDAEIRLWEGLLKWNTLLQERLILGNTPSPQEAKQLIEAGDLLLVDFPDIPLAAEFQRRRPYLETITHRGSVQAQNSIKALGRTLRSDTFIAKVYLVKSDKEERFYCRKQPVLENQQVKFEFYESYQRELARKSMSESIVEYHGLAPVSKFAELGVAHLGAVLRDPNKWESSFVNMLRALRDGEQIDPILRVRLLQDTLSLAVEGSVVLEEASRDLSDDVSQIAVGGIDWVDPYDELVKFERRNAENVLRALRWLSREQEVAIDNRGAELLGPPAKSYQWVGWLRELPNSNWQFEGSVDSIEAGRLLVVVPTPDNSGVELLPVGKIEKGKPSQSASGSRCANGRAVFAEIRKTR